MPKEIDKAYEMIPKEYFRWELTEEPPNRDDEEFIVKLN